MGEVKRERQFGVRYGDGEVNGPMLTKDDAAERINNIRWHLDNDPDYSGEEDLYEPMALVSRWHVVNTSEWVEVGREGEAVAKSYLDTLEGMTADPALLDAIAAVREGRPPPPRRRWWQRALPAAQPAPSGAAEGKETQPRTSRPKGPGNQEGTKDGNKGGDHPGRAGHDAEGLDRRGIHGGPSVLDRS